MVSLINGLGGSDGFGENVLTRGVNTSSGVIDLSGVFENGLVFGNETFTEARVSTNGYIYFADGFSLLREGASIADFGDLAVIAPFFADVDTFTDPDEASPGGTSQGNNLVFYDLNETTRTLTVTWDDVGYFSGGVDQLNAFQLILTDRSGDVGRSSGDFDIEFRYEDVNWAVGNDDDGFEDTPLDRAAVVGLSSGNQQGDVQILIPGSGEAEDVLDLDDRLGNTGQAGRWLFEVRDGQVTDLAVNPTLSVSGQTAVVEQNAGSTILAYTVTRSGDTTAPLTVEYEVVPSGANPADSNDVAGFLPIGGSVSFGVGETTKTVLVGVTGDGVFEQDETLTFQLDPDNLLTNAIFFNRSVTTAIVNDDGNLAPTARNDGFSTDEESAIAGNVFADNGSGADSDPEGDSLSVLAINGDTTAVGQAITLGSGATLTLNADGTFTYDPAGALASLSVGQTQTEQVTYTATDGFGNQSSALLTILVSGEDAVLAVTGTQTNTAEGDAGTSTQTFTVTRSGATQTAVTVSYAVVATGGDGVEGSDFVNNTLPSGTLSFAAGETSKTVTLPVSGDLEPEANETFSVVLSNANASAGAAVLATGQAGGSIANDDGIFTQFGTDENDKTRGTSGNDVISAGGGRDKVRGQDGDDRIFGGDDDDNLRGDDGDDGLVGGAGDDRMRGGDDDDLLLGEAGDDRLRGDKGMDRLEGGEGDDRLDGRNDDDTLIGGSGRDDMRGGKGDDGLFGGDGADDMDGGKDDDFMLGEGGNDVMDGGAGSDLVNGGAGDDELDGGKGDDVVDGDLGNDLVNGGSGDDTLFGNAGNDLVFGDAGNDRLSGGTGDDMLEGGKGEDTFVFEFGTETDTIVDFNVAEDVLVLSGFTGLTEQDFTARLQFQDETAIFFRPAGGSDDELIFMNVDFDSLRMAEVIIL